MKQFNTRSYIKFVSNLFYYLSSVYINMDIVYFGTDYRNKLIYILIDMEVKNNKMFYYF